MPSVHRQTFVDLVNQHGWTRGAELGVDKGILTGMLLRGCPTLRSLTAVDLFPDRQRSRRVFELASEYPALRILEGRTDEVHASVSDHSLDFVFIDADHGYGPVRWDITHWERKVRAGGWMGGHDYHPKKFPGVVRAVDEEFGKAVHHLPGTIWGVWR
jgi:predicted O-methyltransferase YrrM